MKILLTCSLAFMVLISCKKDKPDAVSLSGETTAANFGQLTVGNYWIYQHFKVDSLGVATPQPIYDSCYISKDTVINGTTYFEMYRPDFWGYDYSYLRDSATYIVNHRSRSFFSSTDFSTIFYSGYATATPGDTIASGIFKMDNKDSVVNTPAGSFITSNARIIHKMYPAWDNLYRVRYNNACYAAGVGIVLETLDVMYTDPYSYERRLVRYHVN